MAWSRTSRHARGYGSAWDKLRKIILSEEPLCRACRKNGRVTEGSHVDHITPRSKGGSDERSNLQVLCGPCHILKTTLDNGHKPRVVITTEGWLNGE